MHGSMKKVTSEVELNKYNIPNQRPDSPSTSEIAKIIATKGPNAKIYASPLTNLKMDD
jgi:hypothetical protein